VPRFISNPLLVLGSCLLFLLTGPLSVLAQITSVNNSTSTPIEGAGHDYIKLLSETVDPVNGSTSLRLQLPIPPARGLSIPFAFSYDSNGVAFPTNSNVPGLSSWGYAKVDAGPGLVSAGWSYSVPMLTYLSLVQQVQNGGITVCQTTTGFVLQDATGGRHSLNVAHILNTSTNCTGYPLDQVEKDIGGDDYYQASLLFGTLPSVTSAAGTNYSFPAAGVASSGDITAELPTSIEDSNGNIVLFHTGSNSSFTETDTMGRPVVSTSGFGHTGDTVTVSGVASPFTLTWGNTTTNYTSPNYNVTPQTSGCDSFAPSPGTGPPVVTGISLPNLQQFKFAYDPTYGMLTQITYPSGGYVSYTWGLNQYSALATFPADSSNPQGLCQFIYSKPAVTDRYVSFDGSTIALHQHFSYSTTWSSSQWTSKQTIVTTTDNVSGVTFTTKYNYTSIQGPIVPNQSPSIDNQIPLETTVVLKDSNGVMMRTSSKSWFDQYEVKSEQTTLENNSVSEIDYQYGPGAQITQTSEYDFGSGAHGPLLRKSIRNYQSFGSTPIFDRPCQSITYDGIGTRIAETDYFYDGSGGSTPCLAPAALALPGTGVYTGHDERTYGTSATPHRGNLTKVINQCFIGTQNCASGNSITTYGYDETGQVLSMTDACGNVSCADMSGTNHSTTYSYADSYTILSNGANTSYTPSTNTNAFLTKITDSLGLTHSFKYDFNNSQLTLSTDPNSALTSYIYNDFFGRPTQVNLPDGGQTTFAYNDTPPSPTVTSSRLLNSTGSVSSMIVKDGVGHVIQTQPIKAVTYVDTTYDGENHVHTRSNPHGTSSLPTDGMTAYFYDVLGRLTKIVQPDTSTATTSYSGLCSTFTDEASKSRKSCDDALGRLVQVVEDPNSLAYETDYTYDLLNNLWSVTQHGGSTISGNWRLRAFTYDSLSRLLTTKNPESGLISYSYDANGNLYTKLAPLPNQTGTATVTTTYAYDADNRTRSKNYSDGTPTATFTYDLSSTAGLTGLTNPLGRLVQASNSSGQTVSTYDPMGRIKQQWQCTPINCGTGGWFTFGYGYNLAGQETTFTPGAFGCQSSPRNCYNGGFTLTQTYNSFGQVTALTSSLTDPPYHPPTLISGVTYDPAGQITAMTYGNNLAETRAYNNRLQPCHLNLNSSGGTLASCTSAAPAGNIQDFVYHYNLNVADNGNITWTTGTGQQSFYRTYTYDSLNRLATMADSDPSQVCKGLSWTYDPWGNRTAQIVTAGACGTFSVGVATNNQFVGSPYQYDAAGNMIHDASHSYSYDAEGHITKVDGGSTATYLYDANGRRVVQTTPNGGLWGWSQTHAWYDTNGRLRTMWNQAGSWMFDSLYIGGEYMGFYSTEFVFKDVLGSTRIGTGNDKSLWDSMDFLPFGEMEIGQPTEPFKFTGKLRDIESNLDNFGARHMSSGMGRWISPDAINLTDERVQNPANTLNKYVYGGNNPLRYVDPDGRDITVFYSNGGTQGHFWAVAYDQSTGNSAVLDFGPQAGSSRTAEAIGIAVPGDTNYGSHMTSADEIRQDYASLTIQTNPEDTQKAIEAINTYNSDPHEYMTYQQNCTTVCRNILHKILKLDSTSIRPVSLWGEIYSKWSNAALNQQSRSKPPTVQSKHGTDYGRPRYPINTFDFVWRLLHPEKACVTTLESDGMGGTHYVKTCD
jgi:RHS repeat-associated protein